MSNHALLRFHAFLLADTGTRLDQFARAIAACVRPGDTVLDLGAGSGLLAFLACRAGARRVYAVEESPSIEYGRLLAPLSGFGDRVEFIERPSFQVTLPEPVDVVLGDVFDTLGLQARGLSAVLDARERLLKPGGTLIPSALTLQMAPVEAASTYADAVDVWARQVQGFDVTPMRHLAVNQPHPGRFGSDDLLAAPKSIVDVDLTRHGSPHLAGRASFTAFRNGTLHGACGSFTATLAPEAVVRNTPGDSGSSNFAQALLPIERPVSVSEGDEIELDFSMFDALELRWALTVRHTDGRLQRFEHSTLHGQPLNIDGLRRQATGYQPRLTPRGLAERDLLDRFDGTHAVTELENWLIDRHPDAFPSRGEAGRFVRSTIDRCG